MEFSRKKIGKLSDTERADLAKRLDEDLDNFIDSLAKQKDSNEPKKIFNYDEWCKEIDQHPAFMTELRPNKDGEFSEAVQALQALKYDEEDLQDRRAAAESHKINGNKHFKYKKYRWAINRYTDGINQKCTDRELNSILYANRAAAQKYLGNFNSAFRDCFFARKFDPRNMKAIVRGAECLLELGRGKQCLEWIKSSKENFEAIEIISNTNDGNSQIESLNKLYEKAKQRAMIEERNERKERQAAAKDLAAKQRILSAFVERKIEFYPRINLNDPNSFEWSQIEVKLPWLEQHEQVYIGDDNLLHWPILAQYPETGKADIVTDCSEESLVGDVFESVFQEETSDNFNTKFNRNNVQYFISLNVDKDYSSAELMPYTKIRDAFSTPGFVITQGLPVIQIYTKEHVEANFVRVENGFFRFK